MSPATILEYPSRNFENLFTGLVNQRKSFIVVVRDTYHRKQLVKHKVSLLVDGDAKPFGAIREAYTTISMLEFSSCLGLIVNDGGYGVEYEDKKDLVIKFYPIDFGS